MKEPSLRTRWLAGLAVGVLGALLLVPSTRVIVRTQGQVLVGSASSLSWLDPMMASPDGGASGGGRRQSRSRETAGRALADAYPDDASAQIGAALTEVDPAEERYTSTSSLSHAARRILPMREAKPDDLALNAAFVSSACDGMWLDYRLDRSARGEGGESAAARLPRPPSGSAVTELLVAAQDGERLDPDNAFFPQMQALALFAGRRDSEALEALHRAADKPVWRDYDPERQENARSFIDRAYGEQAGIGKLILYALMRPSHYFQLPPMARLAVNEAVRLELEGKRDAGFQIRRSVAHLGGLVRAGSTVGYGCEIGEAVTRIAMMRPGGAPAPRTDRASPQVVPNAWEARLREELGKYAAYLRSIGQPDEARWIEAEIGAGRLAHGIVQDASNRFGVWPDLQQYTLWIALGWLVGCALLCNVLWMTLLGALYGVMGRRAPPDEKPRTSDATWVAGVGGVLLGIACLRALRPHVLQDDFYRAALAASVPLLLLWLRFPGRRPGAARRGAVCAWAAALALAAAAVLAAGVLVDGSAYILRFVEAFGGPHDGGYTMPVQAEAGLLLAFGVAPVLVTLIGSIGALCCRVSLSAGMARIYRGLAMPAVCILIVAYAAVVVQTARIEAGCSRVIDAITRHEGRYMAHLAGKEWPGRTP